MIRPARFASDNVDTRAFIDALVEVYKAHGMSLAHEDSQGAFKVENYSESNVAWLRASFDDRELGGVV
jgi:hypothetical protein